MPFEANTLKPGTLSRSYNLVQSNSFIEEGVRLDTRSVMDLDFDGRPDIADVAPTMTAPKIYFNHGVQFYSNGEFRSDLSRMNRIVGAKDVIPSYMAPEASYTWETRSGMMDLDGDGIPEGVDFGDEFFAAQTMSIAKAKSTVPHPPHLLYEIVNNRGAVTSIDYASIHSSTVDDSPAGSRMPRAQYVVKQLTSSDSHAGTTSTSAYAYKGPQFLPDDRGHYGFRGFTEVTTTRPSGAQTTERFSYAPDWSGRLEATLVSPSLAERTVDGEVRSIDAAKWEARQLFGGALTTYHATLRDHWTCTNGQTEATCTSAPAARTRTASTFTALATSSPGGLSTPLLYVETSSTLQPSVSVADGDRRTDTAHYLHADAATYRLVTLDEMQLSRVAGQFKQYARTRYVWTDSSYADTSYRVPYQTITSLDATTFAITFQEFDLTTGNVTKTWKPVQWAANPNPFTNLNRTTFAYDSRKLFVATDYNELGHRRDYRWEYGTGTKLETLGPNVPKCATVSPNMCPSGAPLIEAHRIRIDGLGRMIERYETFGADATVYRSHLVERNEYIDAPQISVVRESAYEYDEATTVPRYRKERSDLDGHGRPLKRTVFTFGDAPADEVTRYAYRDDGTLASVTLPDPTANDASTVTYTYSFDSLGRPQSMRRPDGSFAGSQSGVDIAFDGVTQTVTEAVGAAGGKRAQTVTKRDAFDRLIQVEEQLATGPVTWATTTYGYGPDDNIETITDPQGAITSLAHDMDGRRTAITRAGKTWRYGYDKNGNVISEQTPCAPAGTCEVNHTSTLAYDALDRPVSKLNAPRGLSMADQTLFGSSGEAFTYDTGTNAIGRMTRWDSYAPAARIPTTSVSPNYDVQGNQTYLREDINVAGFALTRDFLRGFSIGGQPVVTYYRDVVGGNNCADGSYSQTSFDRRGLPATVQIVGCLYSGTTPYHAVSNSRNVAGLVTPRKSLQGNNAPFTNVQSDWTYDKLGRVTSQAVKKGATLEQVVRQDLTYFGNDDPATLNHWLGTTKRTYAFTYDQRHQLTRVSDAAGSFNATYAYGAAGRFSTATESAAALPNGNVKPRNVEYLYSSSDPEQLVALQKAGTTSNFASYAYDLAGNQTTRDYKDTKEHWDFVYDGKNQLRRATKKVNGVAKGSEEYWYDHDGNRMLVLKRDASGAKTELIWFIGDTEAHYDASGIATRVFGHVSLGTPIFRIDRKSDGPSSGEYQFHGLASNTIAAIDNATGTTNASFNYAPFGEVIEATNGGGSADGVAAHKRRMNDKFIDDIDDLAYYGARYYDRTSMTWTQSDPLFRSAPDAAWTEPRRAALYTMSLNNPLRYVDPDGRNPGVVVVVIVNTLVEVLPEVLIATGAGGTLGMLAAQLGAPRGPAISNKSEEAYLRAQLDMVWEEKAGARAAAMSASVEPHVASSIEEPGMSARGTASEDGGPMARPLPVEAKGQPIAGTGKRAGQAFIGKVNPAAPGPPKKVSNKPVKKSDATKIASRQGKHGGVIGSKTQAQKMDGRQDGAHVQGGLEHTHPSSEQGRGHFWYEKK